MLRGLAVSEWCCVHLFRSQAVSMVVCCVADALGRVKGGVGPELMSRCQTLTCTVHLLLPLLYCQALAGSQ
jgi:hypothetical protein